jgi:TonB-dependent SusC/RagA subfamily outer membrane receptor
MGVHAGGAAVGARAISGALGANEPVSANAALKSVMVYRAGAELTHTVGATLPAGTVELAVDRLSTDIDKNSVQIRVPSAVTLLGFTYVSDYLAEKPKTARQQQLDDSLNRLEESQDKVQLALVNNGDLLDVLKKNRELKGTQTGMNVADLQKLMDYYRTASAELTDKAYELKKRLARMGGDIARIKAQIEEEATQNTRESGRLLLRLQVATAGTYDFTLSYLTQKAAWSPAYEIQVGDARDSSVKVVCKANIEQTTGLDWKQVKMALSTSVPGNWSKAPDLNPWFLALRQKLAAEGSMAEDMVTYNAKMAPGPGRSEDADKIKAKVFISGLSSESREEPLYIVDGQTWSADAFKGLNPSSLASMNVVRGAEATSLYGSRAAGGVVIVTLKKDLSEYTSVDQQRLNTIYTIDLPYDLPSTGKDQTANLQVVTVKALFTYYAVPKVSNDVYLLADIPDWGKLNLLPGEANIVLNGTYLGLTSIDPSSTQDTLHLTVGKDKRITLERRKVTDFSSEKFLASSHLQKYVFEITARNNKNEAVRLSLLDQIPLSSNKDIEITLNDAGNAQVNADKGQLKWVLPLQSGESAKVRFGYTVKSPKGEVLDALADQ